jgi:hypothetical protein
MQEADARAAVTAAPRFLVDGFQAGVAHGVEHLGHVVDLVGDVVEAFAALGDEATDRRVAGKRLHQLDLHVTDPEAGRLYAVFSCDPAMLDLQAEGALVKLDGAVQVLDGETEVTDPLEVAQAFDSS